MNYVFYIALVGLIAGVGGTFTGSFIVLLVREIKESLLAFVLGVSAGIMTVVVFLDLLPEALEIGSLGSTLLGMALGVMLIVIMDQLFLHSNFTEKTGGNYFKSGILLTVSIALHNFPEGLAIGIGFSAESILGFGLAVLMGIHNFPEGMAMATTLSLAGLGNTAIMLIVFFSGIPMGIGALVGAYLGSISSYILSLSLGFAAGAMLYITFDDLIPNAHSKNQGGRAILGILSGIFLGIILSSML